MLDLSGSIKKLRMKNSYTQEQLAAICGVSRQAVTKWECGANLPDIEKIVQLAQLFHVTIDELLTGSKTTEKDSASLPKNSQTDNEKIVNQALRRSMSCDDPDEEIRQFISVIGQKIGCDRVYIFEQNPDQSYKNTYEWCERRVSSQIEYLQNIPLEDLAEWLELFSKGEYVFIKDVDALSDSDPAVYRWLKPQGIWSLLACSLFGGRAFLGVDNPAEAFIDQTSSLLEIMTHFLESMLQRRDLMKELQQAVFQKDQFIRFSKGIYYRLNVGTGELYYDPEKIKKAGYSFRAGTLAQLEEVASLHPEFRDHLMIDGIRKAIDLKENVSIEFISYRKDRKIRWNRLSVSPFLDSSGNVLQVYGFLQDSSEQHRIVRQYNKYISHLSGGLHICYLSRPIHLEYASDDLCAFLGYSREEFEQVVGNRYTNAIVEEDRAVFAGYVERLAAAPGIETCEYRMRKKDGSTVLVSDTMESVFDGSGSMYGYAYVLDKAELHAMLEMAEEHEERQLALINRQYEALEALGKDYLNIFRVWLDEDQAQIVKLKGYVTRGMNPESAERFPYYRLCEQYVLDRVYPDDRRKMLIAMHPDTVRKAFSEDDEYLVIYRAVDHGRIHFYQLKYIRTASPAGEDRINFVAGFKNIDKAMEDERRQREQLKYAYKDTLTGVMNRNAFERDVFADRGYSYAGFLFCDVNNLRETNNQHGHGRGDLLLQSFSRLLKRHFSVDCIYRIGGDEFVCMIGNVSREEFQKLADEVIRTVTECGDIAAVGASYGNLEKKNELIRRAEINMYRMKDKQKKHQGINN